MADNTNYNVSTTTGPLIQGPYGTMVYAGNNYNPQTQTSLYDAYQTQAAQAQTDAAAAAKIAAQKSTTDTALSTSYQQQANYSGQPVKEYIPGQGYITFYPTNTTAKLQSMSTPTAAPAPTIGGGFTSGSTVLSGGNVNVGNGGSIPTWGSTVIGGGPETAAQQQQYDPWSAYRAQAGTQLAGEMSGNSNPANFYTNKLQQMSTGQFSPDDPSYQWRFQQGQQAAERSLGARGLLQSGNAGIELQQYGQGMASQEYQAQFSRMLQGLSATDSAYGQAQTRLMQMAGVGANPVAGGQLGVQQGQLGVNAGQLGVNAGQLGVQQGQLGVNAAQLGINEQQVQNQFSVGMANAGSGGANIWANIF